MSPLILRRAWREVTRTPLASAVIALCIGAGVGSTTTVFAWTEHLVRRPLPAVMEVDRLVSVVGRSQGREESLSYPDYLEWRDASRTTRLAAFGIRQFAVTIGDGSTGVAQPTWGLLVSDNYFDVLGVRASAGRTFVKGESAAAGAVPHAVVSTRFARTWLGGESSATGRQLRVNGALFTVIGVAPPRFSGTYAGLAFDVWIPITMQPAVSGESSLDAHDVRWVQCIGRLRDGTTMAEASAELEGISRYLAQTHPENEGREAFVKALDTGAAQRLRTLFTILLGITALVSLIVCTNVANLLTLRGVARRHEIGVCLALGATRGGIVAQLLVEAALLASAGAAAGIVFARWAERLLPALMPASPLPLALDAPFDLRILVFALATASAMVVVFGVTPAIQTLRGAVLPSASTRAAGGRGTARLRGALVAAQLALSLAALASAGLFLRVNANLASIDRGLASPERVLLVSTDFDQAGFRTADARRRAAEELLQKIRALPGVQSAAIATSVPLGFGGYGLVTVGVPGYLPERNEDMSVIANRVSAGYFETLGISIRAGRAIEERDTGAAPAVVVVNEAFAARFMRGGNAVGTSIDLGGAPFTIAGVAANGKYRFDALDQASPPHVYFAYPQAPRGSVTLHVRTAGPPLALMTEVRQAFAATGPALPLNSPTTLDDYTSLPLFPVRLGTAALGSLGAISLILACAGLYSVVAYRVTQRRHELALRVALGATSARLLRLVLREGLQQAIVGLGTGVLLGWLAMRVIASRLPRSTNVDPVVLAAAAMLLLAVSVVAALVPGFRASRVDPAHVLRGQ